MEAIECGVEARGKRIAIHPQDGRGLLLVVAFEVVQGDGLLFVGTQAGEGDGEDFLQFVPVLGAGFVLGASDLLLARAAADGAAMGVHALADRDGAEPGEDVGVEVGEATALPLLVELAEHVLEDVFRGVGADEAPDVAVERGAVPGEKSGERGVGRGLDGGVGRGGSRTVFVPVELGALRIGDVNRLEEVFQDFPHGASTRGVGSERITPRDGAVRKEKWEK
jgi:hypothetical protein